MPRWTIGRRTTYFETIEVEADSEKEALDKAKDPEATYEPGMIEKKYDVLEYDSGAMLLTWL